MIEPGSSQDYFNCRGFLLETGTRWVRLWADWPSLQPEPDLAPDQGSGASRLWALDRQIAQATADGVDVILTSYRFPAWANGTAGLSAAAAAVYQLEDRVGASGRGVPKDLRFRLPADLGPGSAWARWIEFLVARYSLGSDLRRAEIAALEVVNEPNLQLWPLQGPSASGRPADPGPVTIHTAVAQMFATAQSITAGYGSQPLLLGPGSSDVSDSSRLSVPYDEFTTLLLDALDAVGFRPGPQFAWSQHNYTDVAYDQGSGSLTSRTTSHAATARRLLAGRWAGWPNGDTSQPALLIPEGGTTLPKLARVYGTSNAAELRALQAELLQRNAARMASPGEGAGVAMLGQYLFYSDPRFDSGLCEVDGTKRPAFEAWASLPSGGWY